ncbi:hypothetical protein OPV22_011303 [Ensete ventricosum]|uniref:Uncharacterized protein n=1 Tax=Ensete ventricosum TaxID=4639 RepID=A0AAV8RJA8_ENSVE|nr:hypothetical protein OPV22_011303 [Ensete ventricosum]
MILCMNWCNQIERNKLILKVEGSVGEARRAPNMSFQETENKYFPASHFARITSTYEAIAKGCTEIPFRSSSHNSMPCDLDSTEAHSERDKMISVVHLSTFLARICFFDIIPLWLTWIIFTLIRSLTCGNHTGRNNKFNDGYITLCQENQNDVRNISLTRMGWPPTLADDNGGVLSHGLIHQGFG